MADKPSATQATLSGPPAQQEQDQYNIQEGQRCKILLNKCPIYYQ